MIISKTPYRLSFFGGGTDYNEWFEKHGGLVLAVGIKHHCYITVRPLPPFFEHKYRIVYSNIEHVQTLDEIDHPSVQACLKSKKIQRGLEIHYDGDLPARSGIGSSSSFTVGLLNSLSTLMNERTTKNKLAKEAIYIEQEMLGESVGVQDQIMSASGGFRSITLNKDKTWETKNFSLSDSYMKNLESHILFGFSGISRLADTHARKKIANIKKNKTNNELNSIMDITKDAKTLFEKEADLDEIGKLLHISWQEKKRLAKGVSNDLVDEIYSCAKSNGAFGGKLMGAGGGGFFFFIAPPKYHYKIKQSLSKIRVWVPFKIDYKGTEIIFKRDQNEI